jgi:hypothetical protein
MCETLLYVRKVSSLFYKEREKKEGRKERERGKNVMMARKWREG